MNRDRPLAVRFFRSAAGREPVRDWLRGLAQQTAVASIGIETMKKKHLGSDFDEFLAEEGLLGEVEATAVKRVIAFQLTQFMKENELSKTAMAKRMQTSRSALDRLLNPSNPSVTLQTMDRAARALGKKLRIELT